MHASCDFPTVIIMATNGFQNSFGNDRPPSSTGSNENPELSTDPASSSFFMNDFKKHEDLKTMLDGNKDNLKLEAMKRIIGMVAKGKDASDLFPAVVKNVVSKNIEVKKLVYVYLTRYAEEQQDLALLSISTFQRALKDPNQLIRASALRVLSSIRVPVIVPIMMLAIKEAVMDMSPYVRKTAAHAIPKLYSLDPEQKDLLIEVIEKLLADKTTLVIGSAIQAFEEVCPDRIDLIHKNYRKLCNLLIDVEEWGQVVIINMLTRYCRTQFLNPNKQDTGDEEKPFYDDSDKEETTAIEPVYVMDSDHRLLLRQAKPLLNSMNSSVVMSVAQLYHHCAPKSEVGIVARALIRLLRSNFQEVQFVVLSNIATMSLQSKGMFEPYLKSFYIRSSDPIHVKLLKLEILTNLASETNISTILREFQTYVTSSDKEFAAATIQALGRCASNIAEVTDTCLNGLIRLMSNRDESVVAESVVVVKKLLQIQPSEHKEIIVQMAKILDKITVPMARASIIWLIGEYCDRVPKIAPDVLRKMAKGFIEEEDIVKLQTLNLAAKLYITNSKQSVIRLLCQYVFNLAKYDQNYDIRDRARFLRALIMPAEKNYLSKKAKKIFLSTKPAPVVESKFKDRDQYQLGSLSHVMNLPAQGYRVLPDWPEVAPDPTVRNVEVPAWEAPLQAAREVKELTKKSFYSSSSGSSSGEDSSSSEDSDSDEDKKQKSEESESEESDSEEDSSDVEKSSDEEAKTDKKATADVKETDEENSEESEEDSSAEEDSSTEESSTEDQIVQPPQPLQHKPEKEAPVPTSVVKPTPQVTAEAKTPPKSASPKTVSKKAEKKQAKVAQDLLLDFDADMSSSTPNRPVAITTGNMLTPLQPTEALSKLSLLDEPSPGSTQSTVLPSSIQLKSHELLNRLTGAGLSVTYKFPRTISIFSPKMVSVQVFFTNYSDKPVTNITIIDKKLPKGLSLQEFPSISTLGAGSTSEVLMSIDFNDTTQPAKFTLSANEKPYLVSISGPVGELMQPHTMSESDFNTQQGKLGGMNENSATAKLKSDVTPTDICTYVYETANILQVPSSVENVYKFCGKTLSEGTLVLVTVTVKDTSAKILVNCEKIVIGAMLVKDIKQSIEKNK